MNNTPEINFVNPEEENIIRYKSRNFSVGFVSLLVGLLSMSIGAIAFYFTRPCVVGECNLIPEAQAHVAESVNEINPNADKDELNQLQLNIISVVLKLNTIPSWSSYYNQAQTLVIQYNTKIDDLGQVLESLQLAQSAQNMTSELPLSPEEWQRAETIWQSAIALIQSVKNPFLQPWVNNKIVNYQNNLTVVKDNKNQEKRAKELLLSAQNIATENEEILNNITNLEELEIIENNWQEAIASIREIPSQTTAELGKNQLLDQYSNQLLEVQEKIVLEEKAINLYQEIEETISLANRAEENNQWSQAVNHWQESLNKAELFPPETLLSPSIASLKKESNQRLSTAENKLQLAINREQAREEIEKICASNGKICDYTVTDELIKVFLTPNYLQTIANITQQSINGSAMETQQLINHINQLEKNYRHVSFKYQIPVEVYNPQQRLIIKY